MTYKRLYEDALFKLEHNEITLGKFNEMIKPLEREVEEQPILDKIRAEIEVKLAEPQYQHEGEDWQNGLIMAETIIDKYRAESEEI